MNTKKRRLICIILAFVVTLSGIIFDTVITGEVYGRKADSDNSSVMSADNCIVNDACVCTSETLGMRGNVGVRQICTRSDSHKRDVNHYNGVINIDLSSFFEIKQYTCSYIVKCCDDSVHGVVTEYIHRSDGKKRI